MFEKEIKFIGDFSFNQIRSLGSSFTLDKITTSGIHPAIVQYISAELDYMIYSDRRKLLQQSFFDYTGREISDHFQKISGEIKKHKKISIEDARKLIFQAVSFNINYLVRPRWSLIKLIFNDQPLISAEEMSMMLNYLYYYDYFKKVILAYISKREMQQLSSTEFDIILNKIDNELLNSNQEQVIANSFKAMGDFFNIGGGDRNLIPLFAIETFLKEKNLLEQIFKLKKAIPNEVKRQYDKTELERILFSVSNGIKSEKESLVETEEKTEEVIAAIGTNDLTEKVEESLEPAAGEFLQEVPDKFLSPEEEEALLSLYGEESGEFKDVVEPVEELEAGLSETSTTATAEPLETAFEISELEVTETEIQQPDLPVSNMAEAEISEPEEAKLSESQDHTENIIASDEDIDGILDAINNASPDNKDIIDEPLIDEIDKSPDNDFESRSDITETDLFKAGIEKEIVQEMIKDFYGETLSETVNPDESDEQPEDFHDEISVPEAVVAQEVTDEVVALPESDLLNIFDEIDKPDFGLAMAEKSVSDFDKLPQAGQTEPTKEAIKSAISNTDNLDDYLKDIEKIVFTGKPEDARNEQKDIGITDKSKQIGGSVEVADSREKSIGVIEQKVTKPRNIRPKDLFSYLRKKEIKKIVFFIFANDEEDFTNSVERIMDCNSYKEASEILKAVFTSYKISPYSKEAITFTNAVSNYFRQA